MDTGEGAQQGPGSAKASGGKRGNRTTNQKKRKTIKLEKASLDVH